MQTFTSTEYLLIDIANNADEKLDKEVYAKRIEWTKGFADIQAMLDYASSKQWKSKPLFLKAVMALEEVAAGKPIGHLVGFDAASSGLQINSVITSCWSGCTATGLVDQNRRANAYKDITEAQQNIMGSSGTADLKQIKNAAMTTAYGSDKEPEKIYGKGTDELAAFYEAMHEIVPGAMQVREESLNSWRPFATEQSWLMPDSCEVKVKNYSLVKSSIKVDELQGSGFKYEYYENVGEERGKKNAANITHSIDSYILRSLVRYCNYSVKTVATVEQILVDYVNDPATFTPTPAFESKANASHEKFLNLQECYEHSKVLDICILEHITEANVGFLSDEHIDKLRNAASSMLQHKPFPIVTVHDDFKTHPNNLNDMRKHYNEILANLCEGRLFASILHDIADIDMPTTMPVGDRQLADVIRQANYAIT